MIRLDGPALSRLLAATRARQPKAAEQLGAYVDGLLAELDARRGVSRADIFPDFMEGLRARHPAKPLPIPANPTAPPAPYQDPDDEEETTP